MSVSPTARLSGPTLSHLYTNCCMTPDTLRGGPFSACRCHSTAPRCHSTAFPVPLHRLLLATSTAVVRTLHALHTSPCCEEFEIDVMSNYIPKVKSRCAKSKEVYDACCDGAESRRRRELLPF